MEQRAEVHAARARSGRFAAMQVGLVLAVAGPAMLAMARTGLAPGTKTVMEQAAQCAQQNLDGRYSADGQTPAAGHALAGELEAELSFQYANAKPSKNSNVMFCISNVPQGSVDIVARIMGPARINSTWDAGKCARKFEIEIRPNVADAYAKLKGIGDAKYLRASAMMHEWGHAFEERPIEKYLAKLGLECAESTDAPGTKGRDAWDIAQAAKGAEGHINQFDNVYKQELCSVIENCKIKRGTVVAGKKKAMTAKLKDICERLDEACKLWNEAYDKIKGNASAGTGMVPTYDANHPDCRKPTINFQDSSGDQQSAQLDLDKLMQYLKDHNDAKEDKTKDPDGAGPEKSKVEEKKDEAREAVGC